MKIFKFVLFASILLCGCTQRPNTSIKKSIPSDTTKTAVNIADSNKVAIPNWLIGTWRGDFSEEQYAMSIHFEVVISKDGNVTQTSSVKGEETEILKGKCVAVDADNMSVTFGDEEDSTLFYLDKSGNKLGISENNWLTKKE